MSTLKAQPITLAINSNDTSIKFGIFSVGNSMWPHHVELHVPTVAQDVDPLGASVILSLTMQLQ